MKNIPLVVLFTLVTILLCNCNSTRPNVYHNVNAEEQADLARIFVGNGIYVVKFNTEDVSWKRETVVNFQPGRHTLTVNFHTTIGNVTSTANGLRATYDFAPGGKYRFAIVRLSGNLVRLEIQEVNENNNKDFLKYFD